jgi:hypothetical protein
MTMTRNNVHEPDESDVRHVAGRHLHAAWGHGLGPPRPGENEPDQVDAWISAYAEPFYMRT